MYTKQDFVGIAKRHIKREGLDELLTCLEQSDFYTAPASTVYHDNFKGGLCNHSVVVFDELGFEAQNSEIPIESLAIVSLFHDICKTGYYTETTRNVKDDKTGQWHKEPFYKVNDLFPMGHGEKSLFMINDCMKLTTDEALAVRWHMGGFEPKENYQYLGRAYEQTPLALMLHLADMRATYLHGEDK